MYTDTEPNRLMDLLGPLGCKGIPPWSIKYKILVICTIYLYGEIFMELHHFEVSSTQKNITSLWVEMLEY